MRVEIVICTWNRALLLDQTLASMYSLEVPSHVEWEVLVVNNACTDHTDSILEKHADQLPLRRIWEPKLGKSNALNTAINELSGELILWTDDDVLVEPQWLTEYVNAADQYPEVSFFGGPIDPWFEQDPPPWLRPAWKHISTAYATRQFGDQVFVFDEKTLPYGANLAIRTEVQRRYPYNSRLGRVGSSDVRGEETQMLEQLLANGETGYWVPDAAVRHFIPQDRLTLDYLRQFFYGIGEARTLMELEQSQPEQNLSRLQLQLWTKFKLYQTQYAVYRRLTGPSAWVPKLCRASFYDGRRSRLQTETTASPEKRAA